MRTAFGLAVSALAVSALPGCMPGEMSVRAAAGEPAGNVTVALSANGDNYEISRWYEAGGWTGTALVVPRTSVATGCPAARFFLDDPARELKVAGQAKPERITAPQPPLPDANYPDCSLLLSYGLFPGPPRRAGLVITNTVGVIGHAAREPSHPAYYALTPFETVGEVWLFAGAMLATPVLLPGGVIYGHETTKAEKKKRAQAEAALPTEVATCWKIADEEMRKPPSSRRQPRFSGFTWPATKPGAWTLTSGDTATGAGQPGITGTRVTLKLGRLRFGDESRSLWTDGEFDCDIVDREVVASLARPRE